MCKGMKNKPVAAGINSQPGRKRSPGISGEVWKNQKKGRFELWELSIIQQAIISQWD